MFHSVAGKRNGSPLRRIAVSVLLVALVAAHLRLEAQAINGSNADKHDYYNNWASPVTSYLIPEGNGMMRVQLDQDGYAAVAETYTADFKLQKTVTVPKELATTAGFYSSGSAYFLVSGQDNLSESDSVEVIRVTRYDKNWNRTGSFSLYGANTQTPFAAGSLRMTHVGECLYVRTSHRMYKYPLDGVNHQANLSFSINMNTLQLVQKQDEISWPETGYSSHSFNQYIVADGNEIVTADHGDASPRTVQVARYRGNVPAGIFRTSVSTASVFPISGSWGDNYTGVSLGGLAVSGSTILTVGNSIDQSTFNSSNNNNRNIFVTVTNKADMTSVTKWLTSDGGKVGNPFITNLPNGNFLVLWTKGGNVIYQQIDGNANTSGQRYSAAGQLSDCEPVLINGKLTWYVHNNADVTFYTIDVNNLSDFRAVKAGEALPEEPEQPEEPAKTPLPVKSVAQSVPAALQSDTLSAVIDGVTTPAPHTSGGANKNAWTNYNAAQQGQREATITLTFDSPKRVTEVELYQFTDGYSADLPETVTFSVQQTSGGTPVAVTAEKIGETVLSSTTVKATYRITTPVDGVNFLVTETAKNGKKVKPNCVGLTEIRLFGTEGSVSFGELPSSVIAEVIAGSEETTRADSGKEYAIDGNLNTMWHTSWNGCTDAERYITLVTKNPVTLSGYRYLPRAGSGGGNSNGRVADYEIAVSTDGTNWTVVSTGRWSNDGAVKEVSFAPVTAQYIRLRGVSTYAGTKQQENLMMSAVELTLIGLQ